MTDIDRLVREVLDEDLPAAPPQSEPGFFRFTLSAFRGPGGWVSVVMLVAQAGLFIAGVWAAIAFYATEDPLVAIKWGLTASTLLILAVVIKLGIVPAIESQRVIRELHRLELRVEAIRVARGASVGNPTNHS